MTILSTGPAQKSLRAVSHFKEQECYKHSYPKMPSQLYIYKRYEEPGAKYIQGYMQSLL